MLWARLNEMKFLIEYKSRPRELSVKHLQRSLTDFSCCSAYFLCNENLETLSRDAFESFFYEALKIFTSTPLDVPMRQRSFIEETWNVSTRLLCLHSFSLAVNAQNATLYRTRVVFTWQSFSSSGWHFYAFWKLLFLYFTTLFSFNFPFKKLVVFLIDSWVHFICWKAHEKFLVSDIKTKNFLTLFLIIVSIHSNSLTVHFKFNCYSSSDSREMSWGQEGAGGGITK